MQPYVIENVFHDVISEPGLVHISFNVPGCLKVICETSEHEICHDLPRTHVHFVMSRVADVTESCDYDSRVHPRAYCYLVAVTPPCDTLVAHDV